MGKGHIKVEIDDRSGFCFGVVRAISMAEQCLCRDSGARFCGLVSLGDIVHNDAEVARLEAMGLQTMSENTDIQSLAGRRVLIRAHGEPPATYETARRCGVELVDATCPVVAALQRTVASAHRRMQEADGQVVIFGRRGHAEVRGLVGQVKSCESANVSDKSQNDFGVIVIESEADLDQIDFARPIYFLAQTTSSLAEFRRLADEIRRRAEAVPISATAAAVSAAPVTDAANCKANCKASPRAEANLRGATGNPNVTIHDTICRQVADREAHLAEFARRFDVVVFVAGAKSSNGRVLFEAVRKANPRSYKVQDASELRPEWFVAAEQGEVAPIGVRGGRNGDSGTAGVAIFDPGSSGEVRSVGVCGATSTPRWLMEEVQTAVSEG